MWAAWPIRFTPSSPLGPRVSFLQEGLEQNPFTLSLRAVLVALRNSSARFLGMCIYLWGRSGQLVSTNRRKSDLPIELDQLRED